MPVSLPEQFDTFNEARKRGFLEVKKLKDSGKKICGAFCQYTPAEIIMAAGLYQVGLCGRSNDPIKTAETVLPANLCPLIKASYGHVLEESCPYAFFSDVVVGETTCDGKKKMYELLGERKPMQVIHLPNHPSYERSKEMWVSELRRFTKGLEEKFDVEITDDKLNEAIEWINKERVQAARIYELGRYDPPAITGYDMHKILEGEQYLFDRKLKYERLKSILDQSEENWKNGIYPVAPDPCRPRIVISGTGLGGTGWKVIPVTENAGASIVCYEGCSGIVSRRRLVSEDRSIDPIIRIAEKYLDVPCAVVSPNRIRITQIKATIEEWNVDGFISVTLHSCNPFAIETENIRRASEECGVPLLHLETDFGKEDVGQLATRIEAFVEMLREKKEAALNG